MTDTLYVYTMCPHDEPFPHPVGECPQAGKEMMLRQLWEPQESHREEGDNELVATWGFGTGADAAIPPLWIEVNDD